MKDTTIPFKRYLQYHAIESVKKKKKIFFVLLTSRW